MIEDMYDLKVWFSNNEPDMELQKDEIEKYLNDHGLEGKYFHEIEEEIVDSINDNTPMVTVFDYSYEAMTVLKEVDPIVYRSILLEEIDYGYFEGEDKYYPYWEINALLEDIV